MIAWVKVAARHRYRGVAFPPAFGVPEVIGFGLRVVPVVVTEVSTPGERLGDSRASRSLISRSVRGMRPLPTGNRSRMGESDGIAVEPG